VSAGLILLHSWWGLNDDVRRRAEILRTEGHTVVTPDLFGGRIATTIDEAKALTKGEQENEAMLTGMVDEAVRDLAKKVDHVAIIAWSFGNWYAWKVAKAHRDEVRAVVLFYGLALDDTAAPVPPILSHYAELDAFEDLDDTRKLEREMKAAGNDVRVELYPGTKHWFDEPSRPEFDKAASALAWERTRAFLQRHLRARGAGSA
jgi:carboxymethylenebutenolidase